MNGVWLNEDNNGRQRLDIHGQTYESKNLTLRIKNTIMIR